MPSSAAERRRDILDGVRLLDGLRLASRQAAASAFAQLLCALLALSGEQLLERDEDRRPVVLAGLDGEHAARSGFDREAHHRLVDRADLLDVERAIGEALALRAAKPQGHESFEDAQDATVGHGDDTGRIVPVGAPFEVGVLVRIEELAAARPDETRLVPLMDQPEQGDEAAPGSAPLVHSVGVERRVLLELGVEAAHRVARFVDLARPPVAARG